MSAPVYPVVIVGTDGSPTASEAVARAAAVAAAASRELLIVTAYTRTHPDELGPPSQRVQLPEGGAGVGYQAANDVAHDAIAVARQVDGRLAVDACAMEGDPADVLIDAALDRPGSLVVTGSQGMTGSKRFLLGSVPNKLSHHAVGDLLIARTGGGTRRVSPPKRLLAATDGSETAQVAVRRAVDLAAAFGAEVTMLSVGAGPAVQAAVDAAADVARQAGVAASADVRDGSPADVIVEVAERHDLLVTGSRGMTGSQRFLLGSVPNKISHHVTVDMLIVKTA